MVIWRKSTCGGTCFEFIIEKDERFFSYKSFTLLNFLLKIWQDEKNNFKNWRVVIFSIQKLTCNKIFNTKPCFSKKHVKCKTCRFHGVKWTKTWFFASKQFFKTWHVENFFIQILTRCIFVNPNSDLMYIPETKNWRVELFYFKSDTL